LKGKEGKKRGNGGGKGEGKGKGERYRKRHALKSNTKNGECDRASERVFKEE